MKKLLLTLLLVSCGRIYHHNNNIGLPSDSLWVVEYMRQGYFLQTKQYYLDIYNIKTHKMQCVSVGRYMYDHTSIGDTIYYWIDP